MTGHPAPWPLLDLDVAEMRAAGHEPVPFRQFILKIHSRCNLSCSYCYVYEMADQGWRGLPKRMSRAVAGKAVERIAEHARQHGLPSVDVILHGGEPLLAGPEWLTELVGSLRAQVPARVNIGVQTNGTLLRPPMLSVLRGLEHKRRRQPGRRRRGDRAPSPLRQRPQQLRPRGRRSSAARLAGVP